MPMMQVKNSDGQWVDIGDFFSCGIIEYRAKPKPEKKPDVVRTGKISFEEGDLWFSTQITRKHNARFTFSGETGELIKAEVLK